MKYTDYLREHFANNYVFTISELRVVFSAKKISNEYLRLIIHNLLSSGELKHITKGVYTFSDDVEVVGFAFKPFYYGLQEALSIRNLWEQETNPVVITPRKVRSGLRNFEGRNYLIRRVNRSLFFGFEMQKYGDLWIPVSDIEKTLIDFVYFREPLSRQALKEISRKIDRKKLDSYLKKSPLYMKRKVYQMLKKV